LCKKLTSRRVEFLPLYARHTHTRLDPTLILEYLDVFVLGGKPIEEAWNIDVRIVLLSDGSLDKCTNLFYDDTDIAPLLGLCK
tara:strand:- start:22164 stop:22412 length:249 start_codon:yes stop_codon:yes gene_type:complete